MAILFTNTFQFRNLTRVATILDNTNIEHFHHLLDMLLYVITSVSLGFFFFLNKHVLIL